MDDNFNICPVPHLYQEFPETHDINGAELSLCLMNTSQNSVNKMPRFDGAMLYVGLQLRSCTAIQSQGKIIYPR